MKRGATCIIDEPSHAQRSSAMTKRTTHIPHHCTFQSTCRPQRETQHNYYDTTRHQSTYPTLLADYRTQCTRKQSLHRFAAKSGKHRTRARWQTLLGLKPERFLTFEPLNPVALYARNLTALRSRGPGHQALGVSGKGFEAEL